MDRFNFRRASENRTPSPFVIITQYSSGRNTKFLLEERFKAPKRNITPEFMNPVSTLSKRTCTFGIGIRKEIKNHTGKDSPSPGTYTLPSCFDKEKGGPVMIKTNTLKKKIRDDIPGPGTYNPHSPLGTRSLKFSFTSRNIKEKRCDSPPPNTYNPCFNLVTKANYKNIGFGIGDRSKTPRNDSPGPGTYELPSIFAAPATDRSCYSKENQRSSIKYK